MILEKFKTGWQEAFEHKLESLIKLFPVLTIESVKREHGLLKVKMLALDNDTQYVVDCVTYKIERESATTCEQCGGTGIRRDAFLPEKQCLCWKCYALAVDAIEQRNTQFST